MATIGDVAARAGVSTATVSRALNGKSTVDPELAARVLAAARELGYQPNGPARNLRSTRGIHSRAGDSARLRTPVLA